MLTVTTNNKKRNPAIAAQVLNGQEPVFEGRQRRAEEAVREYIGPAAKIAKSDMYTGNWKFKNANEHFPHEPLLRTVDQFFPYAKGGPLYVDRPSNKKEIDACLRKAAVFKKEGLRYVFIHPDRDMYENLMQLFTPFEIQMDYPEFYLQHHTRLAHMDAKSKGKLINRPPVPEEVLLTAKEES
jgi:hypothetical protein